MVKKFTYLLSFLFLITLLIFMQPVSAQSVSQPQIPHTYWGKVFIGDTPAGAGLIVEAVGPGVRSGIDGNPVTTLAGGVYGEAGMSSQKLRIQGDIEPGTPLDFFIGGVKAEVFPVATNGPWKANYSYFPGENTELNLRISQQVSVSQTREPTPVQTRLPSSAVQEFLPEPSVITTLLPGETIAGNQPLSPGQTVTAGPAGTLPSGQGTGSIPSVHPSLTSGGQISSGGISTTILAAGVIILVIVIGGLYYAMSRKKTEKVPEKEAIEEKKGEEKKQE